MITENYVLGAVILSAAKNLSLREWGSYMEQYVVTGMSCAACQARVEKAVSKVEGVTSCSVSLLTNSMGVEGTASPAEVIRATLEREVGKVFLDVLEDAGVFKRDADGKAAFLRFIATL